MALPLSSVSLRALAKTGAAASTSISEVLHAPHFGFLRAFFSTWLKLDLTTLAATLTIFSTLSGALKVVKGLALKVYWWFTKFCTASISIASSDRLNREIVNWLGAKVLERQATRVLTARTETIQNDAWHRPTMAVERNDYLHEKRVPIQYLPTFGITWFIFERNVFLVQRIPNLQGTHVSRFMAMPQEYVTAPEGNEPIIIMCLGRSVKPIKRFLDTCRDYAEKQRESFITVRASKGSYHSNTWDTTILRPLRPLETVHFDETTKQELVADIKNYLDPATRRFYIARGIPYRRGYLLHGTPGTGKTSLSLALAGYFGLELYLCHLPSVREDSELERLFTTLPPRCIVLLEDIDAVGVKRQSDKKEENEDEDEKDDVFNPNRSRCTLSGVLNVVDGVSSQEGRIVLMTSNHAEMLDKALIRPGRIDRMIFLGNISQRSAELMFLRMFAPDHTSGTTPPDAKLDLGNEELQKLALDFSSQIPEDTFTPAQLQGYLLNRRNSPSLAAAEASAWAEEEKDIMDAARIRAQEAKAWRAKKRRQRKMKHFTEDLLDGDNAAVFLAAARERMNGGAKEERTTETEDKDLEKVGNPDGGAVVSKEGQAEAQKEASILVEKIQRLEELNEALNQGLTNSGAEEGVTKVEGVDANKENMATVRDVGMTEQIRHNPTEA